ncbi:mechanosensitive ion channel family protein [Synechococcus moorigangaii CMS01]|nr:mechanosensitive ion channel family protein [Synechococcus moorigangaii CMS01]
MKSWRSPFLLFFASCLLVISLSLGLQRPAGAILGLPLPEGDLGEILPNNGQELIVDRCVYLDGHCIFKVAAPRSELSTRLSYIQTQLNEIKRIYDAENAPEVQVLPVGASEGSGADLENNIQIQIGTEDPIRLMTVTRWDAQLGGEDIAGRTEQIIGQIESALDRAQLERTDAFLKQQGAIALSIALVAVVLNLIGRRWQYKIRRQQEREVEFPSIATPIATQLSQRQSKNIREVEVRLSQLLQGGAIAAAIFINLGLFPQTRITQVWLLGIFKYPLLLALIALISYLSVRLSYALIAKVNQLLADGALEAFTFITQESNQRLELRVQTFSQVMRSVVTLIILVIALLVCLWSVNIDIAPILAGAGIIGLAVSFAAQNLLKDIINGFSIILEDQYAVGDVINVGSVTGLVENINLRITQIRDAEGRLITIPNGEVRIVANLSNQWSRADLNIPVPYQTNVDQALKILGEVAQKMYADDHWRSQIIEAPVVLGVDNFNERGMIIKLWIKTLPLKQWEVAREFRRRIKIAFEQVGIPIAVPQSDVWLHSLDQEASDETVDP